jgi:hypothetical protein
MSIKLWKYEEVDVRDDVKTALPDGVKLRIFKVTSGDSGKTWYTQILKWQGTEYYFCNCPEGWVRAPLEVLKAGELCKHPTNLVAFLKEKKQA